MLNELCFIYAVEYSRGVTLERQCVLTCIRSKDNLMLSEKKINCKLTHALILFYADSSQNYNIYSLWMINTNSSVHLGRWVGTGDNGALEMFVMFNSKKKMEKETWNKHSTKLTSV